MGPQKSLVESRITGHPHVHIVFYRLNTDETISTGHHGSHTPIACTTACYAPQSQKPSYSQDK